MFKKIPSPLLNLLKLPKKHTMLFTIALALIAFILNQFSGYNFAYISGEKLEVKVIKIYDGDTATLLHGRKPENPRSINEKIIKIVAGREGFEPPEV